MTAPGGAGRAGGRPAVVIGAPRQRPKLFGVGSGPVLTGSLQRYLDRTLGDNVPITVSPMTGGGSCQLFSVERGSSRWVLRRAPPYASSPTAHDVLREFRILDAIKDERVSIARPVVSCDDPLVFEAPFYVMDRIEGRPILRSVPDGWAAAPDTHGRALEELIDALVEIHAVDWRKCGLVEMTSPDGYLSHQVPRWLTQLDAYGGRDLPAARAIADWLGGGASDRPPGRSVPR